MTAIWMSLAPLLELAQDPVAVAREAVIGLVAQRVVEDIDPAFLDRVRC